MPKRQKRSKRSGENPTNFFMKWVAFLFTLFIIAVVITADLGILPRYLAPVYDFPNGDKVGHFVLFGLLDFFPTLAFARSLENSARRRVALTTGLILTVFIAVEEFSQGFFATRTFDLGDLLASCLGVALGGVLALRIRHRQHKGRPDQAM
jgi:VanZ family protein